MLLSDEKISGKSEGLLQWAEDLARRHPEKQIGIPVPQADYTDLHTQSVNFVREVCGEANSHFKALSQVEEKSSDINTYLARILGVLRAVRQDYATGYLFGLRGLIRAEVLSDFLEQAEALQNEGRPVPAASLAGAVLEDMLRRLCDKHGIIFDPEKSTIAGLNMALYNGGIYDKIVMSQIDPWAKIRNEASHGHFNNVKKNDVDDMIKGIRRFGAERFHQT